MRTEKESLNNYPYSSALQICTTGSSCDFRGLLNFLSEINGPDISLYSVFVFLNDEIANYNADIIMNKSADTNVTVGESMAKKYGIGTEDVLFAIDGFNVKDVEVKNNILSGAIDNSIYIYWKNTDEEFKQMLTDVSLSNDVTVFVEDYKDVEKTVSNIINYSRDNGFEVYENNIKRDTPEENKWYNAFNSIFLFISLFFVLSAFLFVCDLWVRKRKKEIAIREVFGYEKKGIILIFLTDLIKFSCFAFVLMFFLEIIYIKIFNGYFVKVELIYIMVEFLVFTIIFIAFLLFGIAYCYLRHFPIEEIRGE